MGTHKPGDLFKAHQSGKPTKGLMKRMKSALPNLSTKHTGTFEGKSNALGHGGRAAQLKARGVPGGVIGNLARAAQAAPGQKNFHGHRAKKKRKTAEPSKQELGMAFKKKRKGAPSTGEQSGAMGEKELKKKRKGATCMKCKGGHPTSQHAKHAKKKSA